jgi:hypothetical protein
MSCGVGGVSRVTGLNIHAGIKRSLISLQNLAMRKRWMDLLLTCDGTVVHSVPSFSKETGSTNNFMVPCVQVPIKQYIAPKQSLPPMQ